MKSDDDVRLRHFVGFFESADVDSLRVLVTPMFIRELGRRAARAGVVASAASACLVSGRGLGVCEDAQGGALAGPPRAGAAAAALVEAAASPAALAGSVSAGPVGVAEGEVGDRERLYELIEARDVEGLLGLVSSREFDARLLDSRNEDGLTPLLVAARMRDPKVSAVLQVLIAHGADSNAPDRLGRSPLHLAALAGNAAATRVLLKAGADVARTDARRGATPAHYASAFARVDTVRLLCATSPEKIKDARDSLGRSPLHWSALSAHRDWASPGSLDVVSALVDAGASPRARDKTGATPAHSAARLGADAFLDHLVRCDTRKAETAKSSMATQSQRPLLHECDNRGVSPLDIMVARYKLSRCKAKLLLEAPAASGFPSLGLSVSLPKFWGTDRP